MRFADMADEKIPLLESLNSEPERAEARERTMKTREE